MDVVQMYRSEKQLIRLYYNATELDIFGSEISKGEMIDCFYQTQKRWEYEINALSYTCDDSEMSQMHYSHTHWLYFHYETYIGIGQYRTPLYYMHTCCIHAV